MFADIRYDVLETPLPLGRAVARENTLTLSQS
jgi:hypothetical protein